MHTAILTLDYAGSPGVEYRTQATVVAAQPLTAANAFAREQKLQVPRPGMTHVYYRVPEGTTTLRVDIDAAKRPVTVAITRPDTRNVTGLGGPGAVSKTTLAIQDPIPGTWEIRLQDVEDTRSFDWQQAKKTEAVPATAVTLKVAALSADAASSATVATNGGPVNTATPSA